LTRRYPHVFARFDHLFFSHRLRHRKPDPAAFTAVASHLGASSEEILFIDDSPANVAAAREAGWHGIQYHDVTQLRHDLDEAADGQVPQWLRWNPCVCCGQGGRGVRVAARRAPSGLRAAK
jgi:FMN phosphatase YigB (HAD superfamily)